jgi:hypothetical protein
MGSGGEPVSTLAQVWLLDLPSVLHVLRAPLARGVR